MPKDEQEPPINTGRGPAAATERTAWFGRNRSGVGFRPYTWQGWLIIAVIVAVLVAVVLLFKPGVL